MNDSDNEIKITIVGYTKTGKSKFFEYLENNNIEDLNISDYQPTNGAKYCGKCIIYNNNYYNLNIWDTSGEEKYKSLIKYFYRDADVILLFFSYNDNKSFQEAKNLLESIKEFSTKSDVIIALIGNKYLEKNYSKENNNILNEEEVLEFVTDNNLIYGHLSILEKYSNGIIELANKIIKEYVNKTKKIGKNYK